MIDAWDLASVQGKKTEIITKPKKHIQDDVDSERTTRAI
jgi:hypothetical protein